MRRGTPLSHVVFPSVLQGRFGLGRSQGPTGDELIVVTLLVASEGEIKVPNISNQEQLRSALNRLGSLRSEQVRLLSCDEDDN